MYIINLLGGAASALIAYFTIYFAGKLLDGYQGKERNVLWIPASFGSCIATYFFFYAESMVHGIAASIGLALLEGIFGTWAVIAIGLLFAKTLERLFKLGDRLKNWSARKVGSKTAPKTKLQLAELPEVLDCELLGSKALHPAEDGSREPLDLEKLRLLTSTAESALPATKSEERKRFSKDIRNDNN